MEWRADKSNYTLRDPGALGALLVYDWRLRTMLTDEEMASTIEGAVSTSVLRHLQRLSLVRALHGVRPQGGRMRIWSMEDALRVQAACDLQRATGKKLSVCAGAIVAERETLGPLFADWERHVGWNGEGEAAPDAAPPDLLTRPDALQLAVLISVRSFVDRHRFDQVTAPFFLL